MHTRDQERALLVYQCADKVIEPSLRGDYKVLAKDLGANIMRTGLCAALAFVQRNAKGNGTAGKHKNAAGIFLEHLAEAMHAIPALKQVTGAGLFAEVRKLELNEYMLATREMLRLAIWFRRAVDTWDEPARTS